MQFFAKDFFYYDVVSLYPTVNALDNYPIGFGKYRSDVTCEDILNNIFWICKMQ